MKFEFNKVVLASNNVGKWKEFCEILGSTGIQVVSQAEFAVPEVEETGLTFIENALLKARAAAKISGLPTLADDSGLAVDALQGQPGIYSARFAGKNATAQDNIQLLIQKMKDVPQNKRSARFVCVLVLLRSYDDPLPIIAEGFWEGVIIDSPRGQNGFGYDPIVTIPEFSHQTVAELSSEIKSENSHRAKAIQSLLAQLK
jgi:XTP/dITP diphosphohydrolase